MQESFITPANFMAKFSTKLEESRACVLMTDDRGSGKTAWCPEMFTLSRDTSIEPVGLVSTAVFQCGFKKSIDLVNLSINERNHLAGKCAGVRLLDEHDFHLACVTIPGERGS